MQAHYLEVALRGAIKAKNLEHVKDLIERINQSSASDNPAKATLEAIDDDGRTFLHYALVCGAKDAFGVLFSHCKGWRKELLLTPDKDGRTILWWAVSRGYPYLVEEIFEACYTTDATALNSWLQGDHEGVTLLHLAAGSASPTLLPWLLGKLDHRDDPISMANLLDAKCNTPLHCACQKKRRQHIATLIKTGAATDLGNDKNESFLTYLEKDPTLFDIKEYNREIQAQILQQQRKRVAENPDNEGLKKLHAQLSSQVSLLELVRQKILFDMEISGPLSDEVRSVLDPASGSVPETLFHHVNQDRLLLEDCGRRIDAVIDRMKKHDEVFNNTTARSFLERAALILFAVGVTLLTLYTVTMACVYATTSAAVVFALVSLPVFWIVTVAICLIFVAVGIFTAIHNHNYHSSRDLIRENVDALLAEISSVRDKLIMLEKTDVKLLPVDPATIRELEASILPLEQLGDRGFNGAIKQLNIVSSIIKTIKQGVIKNKPLTPVMVQAVAEKTEVVIAMPDPVAELVAESVSQKPFVAKGSTPATYVGAMFAQNKQDAEEDAMYAGLQELSPPSDDEAQPLLGGQPIEARLAISIV